MDGSGDWRVRILWFDLGGEETHLGQSDIEAVLNTRSIDFERKRVKEEEFFNLSCLKGRPFGDQLTRGNIYAVIGEGQYQGQRPGMRIVARAGPTFVHPFGV